MKSYITNFQELATTKERTDTLTIIESGFQMIDTREAMRRTVSVVNGILTIQGAEYPLNAYKSIYIIGFGKASSTAVSELERILGSSYITEGIVIDKNPGSCEFVEVYKGDHPHPSERNVELSTKLITLAEKTTEDDLVLVVVSGGGSALLSYPHKEYEQGLKLYESFLKTGGTIKELNTLRKHISEIKGGFLAKHLYPSTVISLIFSDIPGDHFDLVASGPTYKDTSTKEEAEEILTRYSMESMFTLHETPKEDMYFKKVRNVHVVSNLESLDGMKKKAEELGYEVELFGTEVYEHPHEVVAEMFKKSSPNKVLIAGGEPSMKIEGPSGVGGRNEYISAYAFKYVKEGQVFSSFASDGIDNLSHAAGGLIDVLGKQELEDFDQALEEALRNNSHDQFLHDTRTQIVTGPTGSNVSDLLILLTK